MSNLTHIEKQKLEQELEMGWGHVLKFNNRTFSQFFKEVVGIDIYDDRYNLFSGSKANRMRAFWESSSDVQIITLLDGLLIGWNFYSGEDLSNSTRKILQNIILRLSGGHDPNKHNNERQYTIDKSSYDLFIQRLLSLSNLKPQERGFEFERFLRDLFEVNGLSPRSSFRIIGEQIDGSFELSNETYLLEAKWQNLPCGVAELHTFEGKLGEKAFWTRGLFISNSGFSSDGIAAFGRGKKVICMDGFDLSEILRLCISLKEAISAKARRAAETGNPYISVRELFS